MRNIFLICQLLLLSYCLNAQKISVKAGPELLTSFNHRETFIGIGGSIEALKLIKERLTFGINTGFLNFTATKSLTGSYNKTSYGVIPVLLVIHYPLPITPNLYGEDHMGYSFAQNAIYEKTGEKVAGGFTYYFALGYTIGSHFDASVKVGRSRFDKKDNPANVNEHNVGLKIAYIF
jgi:hypothetical protein